MRINSNDNIPIEESFKVEAGPGAGKTDFLVNHIKHVVQFSARLTSMRKIACITYTNTGVETIINRLGKSFSEKVDVSTIHSFLYRNIVKPYASFLPAEYGLNAQLLKGHDEIIVSRSRINKWLAHPCFNDLSDPDTVKQLTKNTEHLNGLKKWLQSLQCVLENSMPRYKGSNEKSSYLNSSGNKVLIKKKNLDILSKNIFLLKQHDWSQGKIDHNDVLFFSMILIRQYPFILEILRAKFPYVFLDEYQDTSPIQAYIVDEIRKKETVVGVIGDKAQSIYSFQGADSELFGKFKVNTHNKFCIEENHRSSYEIVTFLNTLRDDFTQTPCKGKSGNDVYIVIGNSISAYQYAKNQCCSSAAARLVSLSRENPTSNAMKNAIDRSMIPSEIQGNYEQADGNSERKHYLLDTIHAIELAKSGNFKQALKYMENALHRKENSSKEALRVLSILLTKYPEYSKGSLLAFYNLILPFASKEPKKLSAVTSGKVKDFYTDTNYQDLAVCVNIPDDTSEHITIHKSKGNQFENVFVVGNKHIKKCLLQFQLNNEEHRIAYVAFSRAEKRLFLQFDPTDFSKADEAVLKAKFNTLQIKWLSEN